MFKSGLVVLAGLLVAGSALEFDPGFEIDPTAQATRRPKRSMTTICVEIKPSGPQEEPYYMCKGSDFAPAFARRPQLFGPPEPAAHQPHQESSQYQQPPAPTMTKSPVTPTATATPSYGDDAGSSPGQAPSYSPQFYPQSSGGEAFEPPSPSAGLHYSNSASAAPSPGYAGFRQTTPQPGVGGSSSHGNSNNYGHGNNYGEPQSDPHQQQFFPKPTSTFQAYQNPGSGAQQQHLGYDRPHESAPAPQPAAGFRPPSAASGAAPAASAASAASAAAAVQANFPRPRPRPGPGAAYGSAAEAQPATPPSAAATGYGYGYGRPGAGGTGGALEGPAAYQSPAAYAGGSHAGGSYAGGSFASGSHGAGGSYGSGSYAGGSFAGGSHASGMASTGPAAAGQPNVAGGGPGAQPPFAAPAAPAGAAPAAFGGAVPAARPADAPPAAPKHAVAPPAAATLAPAAARPLPAHVRPSSASYGQGYGSGQGFGNGYGRAFDRQLDTSERFGLSPVHLSHHQALRRPLVAASSPYRAPSTMDPDAYREPFFHLPSSDQLAQERLLAALDPQSWAWSQPRSLPAEYLDDPVMRTFYGSQQEVFLPPSPSPPPRPAPIPQGAGGGGASAKCPTTEAQRGSSPQMQAPPTQYRPPSAPSLPPPHARTSCATPDVLKQQQQPMACASCPRPDLGFQPVFIAVPCYGQQTTPFPSLLPGVFSSLGGDSRSSYPSPGLFQGVPPTNLFANLGLAHLGSPNPYAYFHLPHLLPPGAPPARSSPAAESREATVGGSDEQRPKAGKAPPKLATDTSSGGESLESEETKAQTAAGGGDSGEVDSTDSEETATPASAEEAATSSSTPADSAQSAAALTPVSEPPEPTVGSSLVPQVDEPIVGASREQPAVVEELPAPAPKPTKPTAIARPKTKAELQNQTPHMGLETKNTFASMMSLAKAAKELNKEVFAAPSVQAQEEAQKQAPTQAQNQAQSQAQAQAQVEAVAQAVAEAQAEAQAQALKRKRQNARPGVVYRRQYVQSI